MYCIFCTYFDWEKPFSQLTVVQFWNKISELGKSCYTWVCQTLVYWNIEIYKQTSYQKHHESKNDYYILFIY